MAFEVVKNGLNRDALFKALTLENERYLVKFFYEGDYVQDRACGACPQEYVTMICNPKADALPLSLMSGHILLSMMFAPVLSINEMKEFRQQLSDAIADAEELEAITKEYFG